MPYYIIYQFADLQQLQFEAQHRWLRPAEICEILRNYRMFHITSEPPNRPPSMVPAYITYKFITTCSSSVFKSYTYMVRLNCPRSLKLLILHQTSVVSRCLQNCLKAL